jgi:hypothetical protein
MFIVVEMQTNGDVTAVVPPVAFATRNEAEARYHAILSAAAVSEVEIHACAVLDERGVAVLNHCYYHLPEPEAPAEEDEPEPEPEIPVEEDELEVPTEEESEEEPVVEG